MEDVFERIENDIKLFSECLNDGDRSAAEGFLIDVERIAESAFKSGKIRGTQYVEIVNVNLPLAWNQFYRKCD